MSSADFDFRDPEKLERSTAIEEAEAEFKAELPWKRVRAEEYFPEGDMNITKRVAAFKVRRLNTQQDQIKRLGRRVGDTTHHYPPRVHVCVCRQGLATR